MDEAADLSSFLPQDTAVLAVKDASGTRATGWAITFAGPSHPKAVAWANNRARQELGRAAQIEAAQVNGRKFKPEQRSPEDVARDNVGWVVARIVDWTPVKIGGEVIAFSEAAATELLMRPDMGWVLAQAVEFLGAVENFTPASATA